MVPWRTSVLAGLLDSRSPQAYPKMVIYADYAKTARAIVADRKPAIPKCFINEVISNSKAILLGNADANEFDT